MIFIGLKALHITLLILASLQEKIYILGHMQLVAILNNYLSELIETIDN